MKRAAVLLSLFLMFALTLPAQRVSYVRIVRLSLVQGPAFMNEHDGQGWRRALLNAPISQQTQLRTGADGRVEVQFEDGSTIQLLPDSQIGFTTLNLVHKVRNNVVTMLRGSAVFTLHRHDSDGFVARFPGGFATVPEGKAWFRVNLGGVVQDAASSASTVASQAVLHVLDGHVALQTPDQVFRLNKYDQLTLRAAHPAELTKNKVLDNWDEWSHQRQQEAQVHGWKPHHAPAYGLAELASAGTWSNGCWAPSMGAGWSPYTNGNWFWDPALGYTWVSGYSWGWLPYHYGSWLTNSAGNWCWSPGASPNWYSYYPQPQFIAYGGGALVPGRPPMPPPPVHRRDPVTAGTPVQNSLLLSQRVHSPVLRIPPPNVRRVLLPPAPQRMPVNSLTPSQRAAYMRARQSRQWSMQQMRMRTRMQQRLPYEPNRGGNNNNNNPVFRSQPAPAMRSAPSMPMPSAAPRMEPAPRMGGGPGRPH